jgi:hypothetical protein
MNDAPRTIAFYVLKTFKRMAKGVVSEAMLNAMVDALTEQPDLGDVVVGAGGFRKMRWALPGRGKSGSLRVIYYYRTDKGRIYFARVYEKAKQSDLSDEVIQGLKETAKRLKAAP